MLTQSVLNDRKNKETQSLREKYEDIKSWVDSMSDDDKDFVDLVLDGITFDDWSL